MHYCPFWMWVEDFYHLLQREHATLLLICTLRLLQCNGSVGYPKESPPSICLPAMSPLTMRVSFASVLRLQNCHSA